MKSCVLLDPEDATELTQVKIHPIPTVRWDEPLTHILKIFSDSRSHMAIVSRRGEYNPIVDEADAESVMTEAAWGMRKRLLLKKIKEKVRGGDSDSDSSGDEEKNVGGAVTKTTQRTKVGSPRNSLSGGRIIEAAKLQPQEQILPSDAQLPNDNLEKVSRFATL